MARSSWSPNRLRWEIAESFDGAESLGRELRLHPLVAQVLHNRGLDDPARAGQFLDPKLTDMHDPELLAGVLFGAGGKLLHHLSRGESGKPFDLVPEYIDRLILEPLVRRRPAGD